MQKESKTKLLKYYFSQLYRLFESKKMKRKREKRTQIELIE